MNVKQSIAALALLSCATAAQFTVAAATPEEAARLKADLTPFGAEKAGNREGSIPAWDGGYTKVWPGYRSGQPRPDPFADEKPLFQIQAANADRYADRLSDGVKELLRRFPTYRLDVYPTHRTAAAPQWVYDNTFRNATRAGSIHNGLSVTGVHGGIPFPLPKDAAQVMLNHLQAWKGEATGYDFSSYVVIGGNPVLATAAKVDFQYPYYYQDAPANSAGGIYSTVKLVTTAPPFKAGEIVLAIDPVDQIGDSRKAWQYLAGQRRVRRAPNIGYDTPSFLTSGFSFFDEAYLFNGAMDRYDWKLVGKQEMFVPYNAQAFHTTKINQLLGPRHLNPDHVRWELHRVWVVEATLAPGKRHALSKRRFYVDEDTWIVLLADGWDARGQLWHTGAVFPLIAPEFPAVVVAPYVIYDFLRGGYLASSLFNEGKRHYQRMPRRPESDFSPAALASEGVR